MDPGECPGDIRKSQIAANTEAEIGLRPPSALQINLSYVDCVRGTGEANMLPRNGANVNFNGCYGKREFNNSINSSLSTEPGTPSSK